MIDNISPSAKKAYKNSSFLSCLNAYSLNSAYIHNKHRLEEEVQSGVHWGEEINYFCKRK